MRTKLRQKITKTLVGRLSVWYVFSVGLIILLFFFSASSLFWIVLQGQIDHHIHIAVNEAHQIVENYRGKERETLIKNLVSAQGMTVVVLSADGAPIMETNSPDIATVTEHQLQKILTSKSLYGSSPFHFTESNIRFAAMPVEVSAGKGIVAVGYSTRVIYATFYKMLGIIAGIVIFLVLPITLAGYKFLKRELQPLENIATQAKAVTNTSLLSKRIRINNPTEELTTIQEALNTIFKRLEKIFENEQKFFSDAAHTLKTPLAILRSQIENTIKTQKLRHNLLKTIDAANETVEDLLFLAKIHGSSEKIVTFSLTDLVNDLSELAATLGEELNLKVIKEIQPNVSFSADKKLLKRALSNIVYNAVIYNKPNGKVNLCLKKKTDLIKITIKDAGIGIAQADLKHVFSRFFRGENVREKGSGLGLSISKAVVEKYGGQILIQSKLNQGTTVTITF